MGLFSTLFGNQMQQEHDKEMYWLNRSAYLQDRKHAEQYNSPSAQVQRLKDAGLNPTLAMSNIQTGQVSTPNAPNAQPSQFAPLAQGLTEGVLNLLGAKTDLQMKAAQTRDIAADAKLKEIHAESAARENMARIYKLEGEGRESWRRGDHIDSLATANYQKLMASIGVDASQAELNWMLHATKMKELQYLPIDKSLSWIERIANIQESYTRQEVNKRQAEYLIEKTTSEVFGWKDKEFQYNLNKKTENYIIKHRKHDVWKGSTPMSWLGTIGSEAEEGLKLLF